MENTNYTKNRRKNCGSCCLIDKYSIAHGKILKIFGHGNLQVFRKAIFLHISFVKNKNRRKQIC